MTTALCSIVESIASTPKQIYFFDHDQPRNGHTLLREIRILTSQISQSPYQRIALCFQNTYLFTVALLASLSAQRTPILLPNYQAGTLQRFASEYDTLLSDDPSIDSFNKTTALAEDQPLQALSPEQTLSLFTSGTTGTPQKITRSLACLAEECLALEQVFGPLLGPRPVYSTVSHQHIYGLLFSLCWPLCTNRVIHTTVVNYAEQALALCQQGSPFTLISSPAFLQRLFGEPEKNSSCVVFSSGGLLSKSAADLSAQILGHAPIEVLGSTETGGVGYRQQAADNSDWTPLPHVKLSLDPSAQILSVDSPFFIESHPLAMSDGAVLHVDGSFTLLGRTDRLIKLEGKRISLDEIESLLNQSPLVDSVYAMMLTSCRHSIALAVCLTPAGLTLLAEKGKREVNAALKQTLTPFIDRIALPRQFRYLNQLPYNAQGKLLHEEMAALFEKSALKSPLVLQQTTPNNQPSTLQLYIPKELRYFDGHFNDTPVLAGVVQIDWALNFAKNVFAINPTDYRHIAQVKFTSVIYPEQIVSLSLKLENQVLHFTYFDESKRYSFGKIKAVV